MPTTDRAPSLAPFIRVTPLHALHHRWASGQEQTGKVGQNWVFWLVIKGRVVVDATRGHWELDAGTAFMFSLSGERTVSAPIGAEWLSVSLRATIYDSLDLLALLPLPVVWTPQNDDFAVLQTCCEGITRSWGAPEYAPVNAHTFPAYLRQQRQNPLDSDAAQTLLCEGYARVLFSSCWKVCSSQRLETAVGSCFPVWMPVVLARLRETPGINVEELARAVGISRRHLGRVFQSTFGTSPRAFLTQRRVEEARQLLQTSFLPLAEIARQTGFSDVSHLSRAFKAALGVSPETYRQQTHDGHGLI